MHFQLQFSLFIDLVIGEFLLPISTAQHFGRETEHKRKSRTLQDLNPWTFPGPQLLDDYTVTTWQTSSIWDLLKWEDQKDEEKNAVTVLNSNQFQQWSLTKKNIFIQTGVSYVANVNQDQQDMKHCNINKGLHILKMIHQQKTMIPALYRA